MAYPEAPRTTSWQDSLAMVGEALGRSARADELKAEAEATIEEAKAENPVLDGAELIYGYLTTADLSTVGIYAPQDPASPSGTTWGWSTPRLWPTPSSRASSTAASRPRRPASWTPTCS
ncbi:hypothetical protein [Nocardioides sp. B-3]|uniref:hypothetical protein n=1 Tax=Nocardioides sp. B-3 TaxID=2895565 RepID=UPI002152E1D1|nr:hypothetical protein [Nocardioides sp. B-3]UUZ61356.1 hypothetical protein LP418_12705 [Nocardioides sp. B-3]